MLNIEMYNSINQDVSRLVFPNLVLLQYWQIKVAFIILATATALHICTQERFTISKLFESYQSFKYTYTAKLYRN